MYAVFVPIPVYIEKWACITFFSYIYIYFFFFTHHKPNHIKVKTITRQECFVTFEMKRDAIQMVYEKCILG